MKASENEQALTMEEENSYMIFLKKNSGESISVEVFPDDTVGDLKERISNQVGVPFDFESVKIEGKIYDDDTNLLEYFSSVEGRDEDGSAEVDSNMEALIIPDSGAEFLTEEIDQDIKPNVDGCYFCAAPKCSSNKFDTPDIQLFRFPVQKLRCQKWIKNSGRTDLLSQSVGYITYNFALCAKHFRKDQFASKDEKVLKQTAIPTIFTNTFESVLNDASVLELNKIPIVIDANKMRDKFSDVDLQKLLLHRLNEADNEETFLDEEVQEDNVLDNLEPVHPGTLCRLCADPLTEISSAVFIFSQDAEKESLSEKINSCLPISVKKTDPLPKQICLSCQEKLEASHAFAETCINAEIKLKTLTKQFLVHNLKQTPKEDGRSGMKTSCCPLCTAGEMKIHGNDKEAKVQNIVCIKKESSEDVLQVPTGLFRAASFEPENTSHDFLNELYSDDDDFSEEEEDEEKGVFVDENPDIADSLYLQEDQVELSYDCAICEENFQTAFACLEHCRFHGVPNNVPCLVCGLTFTNESELQNHFANHKGKLSYLKRNHGKPIYGCGACSSRFSTRKDFMLHKCSQPVLNIISTSDEVDLFCHMCDKSFKNIHRAVQHQQLHSTKAKIVCQICNHEFENDNILSYHMRTLHEAEDPPSCQFCQLKFYTEEYCEKHEKIHQQTTYQCSLCSKTFRELETITNHVETHSEKQLSNLHCTKCDLKFTKRSHFLYHLENSHSHDFSARRMPSLIQYQCKICSERFTSSQDVIVHRTTHWKSDDPLLPHVCEYCGESHPSPNALARHRRILHPDEHPYLCTVCGVRTRTLYEARVHRKVHTGYIVPAKTQSKIHQCEHCPSLFSDKASFLSHKKSHKASKGFQCEYCDKVFPERHRLIVHRRQHTGEKPFSCGVCGKKFAQTSAMYTHSLLHTGETPHSCDLCGRRFRIKSDRDNHRRTHTGEKPYKCEHCDKTFRTGQVYYQHRMIHTGERRFPCDVCGRAFKRSHTLVCHKRIHTGEKPNICDVCGKGFRQRTDMRKHKMNLHGVAA